MYDLALVRDTRLDDDHFHKIHRTIGRKSEKSTKSVIEKLIVLLHFNALSFTMLVIVDTKKPLRSIVSDGIRSSKEPWIKRLTHVERLFYLKARSPRRIVVEDQIDVDSNRRHHLFVFHHLVVVDSFGIAEDVFPNFVSVRSFFSVLVGAVREIAAKADGSRAVLPAIHSGRTNYGMRSSHLNPRRNDYCAAP